MRMMMMTTTSLWCYRGNVDSEEPCELQFTPNDVFSMPKNSLHEIEDNRPCNPKPLLQGVSGRGSFGGAVLAGGFSPDLFRCVEGWHW